MLHTKAGGTVARARIGTRSSGTVTRGRRTFPRTGPSVDIEKLGAGGYVTSLSISPDGNTRICGTDVGGGWRWDSVADRWMQLVTSASMPAGHAAFGTAVGVHSVAAANSVAYMTYQNRIYRSTDGARTWVVSADPGPTTQPNSSDQRTWTRHMVIDPNNSSKVLIGTFQDGVWYTTNSGTTWTAVPTSTVPAGTVGVGVPCVAIDGSGNWYAAPYGSGVYRSADNGSTWAKISNDTDFIGATGMEAGPNGDLLVVGLTSGASTNTGNSVVFRYRSGAWTNVTPSTGKRWRSLAYDPLTPGRVLVQSQGLYEALSTDYGTTWVDVSHTFTSPANDIGWLGAAIAGIWVVIAGVQFDPVVSGRVWMSQGLAVWRADLSGNTAPWTSQARGIEELVVNHLLAPPGGKTVVACWDRPLFLAGENPGGYPTHYHPVDAAFGGAWHADYDVEAPNRIAAAITNNQSPYDPTQSGISSDGGHAWTAFATIPAGSTNGTTTFGFGSIHLSGSTLIWVSAYSHGAYYSTDNGSTWTKITNLPGSPADSAINSRPNYIYRRCVAAEKTTGHAGTFYFFVATYGVFKSTDGGATWTQQCNNTAFVSADWTWNMILKAVPGQPGNLFATPGPLTSAPLTYITNLPFKRSTDGGVTWTTVPGLTSVFGFDFGAPATGSSTPSLYAIGYASGVPGLYRSLDLGDTWSLIDAQPNGSPTLMRSVAASKDSYGTVWISADGQGAIVGRYP